MGRRGKVCLLYQINFDEDELTYELLSPTEKKVGTVNSLEHFNSAVSEILDFYKTKRIEVALRRFRVNKVSGICPKSFPRTTLTNELLTLINLCVGGQSGTDIVHLPFEGTILDQPNLFIEAYHIFCNQYNLFLKELRDKDSKQVNNEDNPRR